jgi:tRNA modification GTPase
MVLFVLDQSVAVTDDDLSIFKEFEEKPIVVVCNKADLPAYTDQDSLPPAIQLRKVVAVSAKYHQGMDALKRAIQELIIHRETKTSSPVFINRLRHKRSLQKAAEHLGHAVKTWTEGIPLEFAALDLRIALDCIGEVVGETSTEDILDQIFSEFCIGK